MLPFLLIKLLYFRYDGQKHSHHGYLVLLLAASLTVVDALSAVKRTLRYILAVHNGESQLHLQAIWREVVLGQDSNAYLSHSEGKCDAECVGLVTAEPDEMHAHEMKTLNEDVEDGDHLNSHTTERWANEVIHHRDHHREYGSEWRQSMGSDGTLFQAGMSSRRGSSDESDNTTVDRDARETFPFTRPAPLIRRIGAGIFATLERVLVFLGYAQVLTGIVVYSGTCRDSYVNGCLAHLISECRFSLISYSFVDDRAYRGRHILVLRPSHIREVFGHVLRAGLGMEPCTSAQHELGVSRVCRMPSYLRLRCHEYMDGTIRYRSRHSVQYEGSATYQHCGTLHHLVK